MIRSTEPDYVRLCPHDSRVLRWLDDKWWCPKCRDEFTFDDDVMPDEDGDR